MTLVHLEPIYQQILNPLIQQFAEGLALALAAWLLALLNRALKPLLRYLPASVAASLETKASQDLNTALANGVAAGMHKIDDIENLHSDVAVKDKLTAFAVQYAIDTAPAAIARFGMTPDLLATKALAYIPVAPSLAETTGAVVRTIPVTTKPLAPITAKKK